MKYHVPDALPIDPAGFTSVFLMHMSCSDRGGRFGVTVRAVQDPDGKPLPITVRSSSSRIKGGRSLSILGVDESFRAWRDLVAAWPRIRPAVVQAVESGGGHA